MKILVTFALENEFAPWRAMRSFRAGRWGKADVHFAQIAGAEVGVVLTGVGPRLAATCVQHVLRDEDSIQACISSGLAGALRSNYAIAQVLAPKTVRGETEREDVNGKSLECSGALLSFAEASGATIVNRFYTSERVIGTQEEKQHLGEIADAVEMESFEVLAEAAAAGVPALAIRAVSDLAGETLPLDMNEVFTEKGQVSVPRVLGQVARRPGAMPGLVKLGKQSKVAAESLAKFLDRYIATVAERTVALGARSGAQ